MPTWKNILTEASTSATNLTSIGTLTSLQVDNINVNANTIGATNTNGNVILQPNGTGFVEIKGNVGGGSDDNPGAIRLNCAQNSHGITIKSPPHASGATYTLTLPDDDGDANQFLKTNGSGVLSWDDPAALTVAQGGTGATSFADKAVLITQDSGTDTVSAAAMSSNGQLLIGGTSGPAVATLTAGSNITITNADGAITIASSGGGGSSGIASVSEDSSPTLGGDLIVGSNDIKSVGDVEVVVDSDSNTSDSSFTVKNGAGTVLFSVNESGVTTGLITTTTPTLSNTQSSYQQGASSSNIDISNHASGRTYQGKIFNSSGVEQTGNPVTIDSNGNVSFTVPSTIATNYELRIVGADVGKLRSAEVTHTFDVTASRNFSYWRLQVVDSSGNNSNLRIYLLEADFYTGADKGGTVYPTAAVDSTNSGGGATITSGYEHSSTYDDWKAFDNSTGSGWWTLGLSNANLNYIQMELTGGAQTIQSVRLQTQTTFTYAEYVQVLGSNTGSFSGEEILCGTASGMDGTSDVYINI